MPDRDGNPLPGFEQDWADTASDGACTCEFWTHVHDPVGLWDGRVSVDPGCDIHGQLTEPQECVA